MPSLFPPFDPDETHPKRYGRIQLRYLLPNLITVVAIVAGINSVRFAFEGRFELAVVMLFLCAALDGIDGRMARWMQGSSRFGEQLDSLADFVNFGVAPALVCYFYILHAAGRFGWLAAVIYCVACGLRLARFNAAIGQATPDWQKYYFSGVPAPAGGLGVLLPLYLGSLAMPVNEMTAFIFSFYTLMMAVLMVSNLPTFNVKSIHIGIRRDMVVPGFLFIVAYFVLLVTYSWETISLSVFLYLALLPVSLWTYRRRAIQEEPTEKTDEAEEETENS